MQLTLLSTFPRPTVAAGPVPLRGSASPSREAVAKSQLDRIAAQNLRDPVHGLGGTGMLLALVGGLVVLGSASMWRSTAGEPQHESRKVAQAESRAAPVTAPTASPAAAPAATTAAAEPTTPSVVAAPEPALHALAMVEAAPAAAAVTEPAADDAARKARAKEVVDTRRKAAQLAQERALAEETQRLQLAQQREAERAQQQLDEQARQRAAAEQARTQSLQLALNTRRSVGESCAAGSLLGRQFCRARECGKAEHQGDAVCVSMREDELAQQRASINR